ncbi:P-loop containing nucleoside triphosphate hydrolase protein [Lactarius akahatsu]|uniref:Guanine nucleotide-binding protein-like 1 n=1 Tax=Lactarius akahatsu TaxID=416441 RepID=A0AAD4LLA7_9AGAM|nr:P-loop containing nucleoside triphosphate hydrolase protein [Lactarius akahatsu]
MHRKKPVSGKQHKAQIQAKRARKRERVGSEPQNDVSSSALPNTRALATSTKISAQRRLESSFVRLPATLLDQSKAVAASVALVRPITAGAPIWTPHSGRIPSEDETHMRAQMTCMRRPKWRYEMSKNEVEKNEAGLFAKWLAKSDSLVEEWQTSLAAEMPNTMPISPSSLREKFGSLATAVRISFAEQDCCSTLELLRFSWSSWIPVAPLLHLPPSLVNFISLPRYRVILVLTKVDISGPQRAEAWASYLRLKYPSTKVVMVESYSISPQGPSGREGTARRGRYEPHIPRTFKEQLVTALKEAHHEMLQPPERIKDDPEKMSGWRPSVKVEVDWDVPARKDSDGTAADSHEAETDVLTIGLIGQPNVGKSSLLNALFGTTRVRASKTPGKTKHFQTLFWSSDIRLVDCPGLVLPDLVLSGVLPIARMPAISLCMSFAAKLLPLEDILGLVHPSVASPPPEDKRTWREGVRRPQSFQTQHKAWTAMDLMTAYANKRGWVTAKAGRPDVNRAGNAILRFLAEGKIKWAFWPPGYDESHIPDTNAGYGIWVPSGVENQDPDIDNNEEGSDDDDDDDPETGGESSGSTASSSRSYQARPQGFELLSLLDNH